MSLSSTVHILQDRLPDLRKRLASWEDAYESYNYYIISAAGEWSTGQDTPCKQVEVWPAKLQERQL